MSLGSGLTLMAVVFLAMWVLFFVVSELIIRRGDRRTRKESE
jgi:hypothetical protein